MPTCRTCDTEKLVEEFNVGSLSKDRSRGQCLECSKAYQKARRRNPTVESLAKRKEYYANHFSGTTRDVIGQNRGNK